MLTWNKIIDEIKVCKQNKSVATKENVVGFKSLPTASECPLTPTSSSKLSVVSQS